MHPHPPLKQTWMRGWISDSHHAVALMCIIQGDEVLCTTLLPAGLHGSTATWCNIAGVIDNGQLYVKHTFTL